jgi:hypothetical protein
MQQNISENPTATLHFNGTVWHGHTQTHCMSMSQETFQRYVSAYVSTKTIPPYQAHSQEEAMQRVTQLSYWAYARYDRTIRLVRLPGCILTERGA